MKYFIIVTLTIAFIQFTNCDDSDDGTSSNKYGDDGGLYGSEEEDEDIDARPKPIYDIQNAPEIFKKFIKDYAKHYKDDDDYQEHYKSFVENLKEINRINSDKEYSATVDINAFTDFSESQQKSIFGIFE